MEEKKPRFCSYCKQPIEEGFLCKNCKQETRREITRRGQKAYYLRRKEAFKKLQEENARLKQIVQELNNANKESSRS